MNGVLVVGLLVFAFLDYQRGLRERLQEKEAGLSEEAALVLPAVAVLQHHGDDAVQDYIDRACAQMQQTISPGHHISVKAGNKTYEAQTHLNATLEVSESMRLATHSPETQGRINGRAVLVGSYAQGDIEVYISEFTDNVRQAARARLVSRVVAIVVIGLVLTLAVNMILLRVIIQPIAALTRTLRTIGEGHLSSASPRFMISELDFLSTEIGQMSRSLDEAARDRRAQMRKASAIQHNLMPGADDLEQAGVHHAYLPAEDVGGDFFEVKPLGDGQVVVCLGDVTGHGVPAALSAAMLKTLFQNPKADLTDPAEVLEEVNQRFYEVTLVGDFATLFMGVVDRNAGKLHYASAGHEVGFLIRKDADPVELCATGLLLGVDPKAIYQTVHLDILPGDKIVVLTDGLAETMSARGEQLGRHTLAEALSHAGGLAPAAIADKLLRMVVDHQGDQPQQDDITLAVLEV